MGDKWSSKKAFVLASIGAAVGLGNIWRFPYIASEHGGLWFLLPYLVCLAIVGIPLFVLEAGQGFLNRKSFFKSVEGSTNLKFIKKQLRRAIGLFPILVSTVILAYYSALCAWTLWFAIEFVLGNEPTFALLQQSYTPLVAFAVVFACALYVSMRGISNGIEIASGYLVPLLFVFLLLLFAYSLTLPDAILGLADRLLSEPQKVLDARTWYYALSQVLFSLSVGYGIMYTYGMHLKSGRVVFSSGVQVAGADTAAAVVSLFTISIMAAAVSSSAGGFALSFEALPAFFAAGGLVGSIVGTAFFLLLFCAAFTSVLSMLEHTSISVSFAGKRAKWAVLAGVFMLGILSVLSYSPLKVEAFGKPVLDFLDFTFGTFLAPFSALAIVFCCAYLLPHRKVARAMGVPKRYWGLFEVAFQKGIPAALLLLIFFSQLFGLY